MKKLKSVIYHKLLLQAQEAKAQEMCKLASGVVNALGPMTEDEDVHYNKQQLYDEIYDGMWKLATHVIKYYDVESADVSKIHDRIEALAEKFVEEVTDSLDVNDVNIGPLESRKIAAKTHRDKRNGYIDLKGGGWGVEVHSNTRPESGDRVFVDLSYLADPPTDQTFTEETIDQVLNEVRDFKNKVKYICSIQSQDQARKIMQPANS